MFKSSAVVLKCLKIDIIWLKAPSGRECQQDWLQNIPLHGGKKSGWRVGTSIRQIGTGLGDEKSNRMGKMATNMFNQSINRETTEECLIVMKMKYCLSLKYVRWKNGTRNYVSFINVVDNTLVVHSVVHVFGRWILWHLFV